MYAWHDLLFERHTNGPPSGPDLSYHAALWPARIVFGNMQVPLQINFENSEPSEAIRSEIEKHSKRLEKFHDRITSCKVAVITPQTRHRKGDLFKIDIRITMPEHKDIFVTKTHGDAPAHEHVAVAINDAFAAAQRQVEDAVRKLRGH